MLYHLTDWVKYILKPTRKPLSPGIYDCVITDTVERHTDNGDTITVITFKLVEQEDDQIRED